VLALPPAEFGRARAPPGTWASCIRIVDPAAARTVRVIPLDNNEAAFSLAIVPFAARGNELHLVVGTAQDRRSSRKSAQADSCALTRSRKTGPDLSCCIR
jgi:splicing factor 3B subunit 3